MRQADPMDDPCGALGPHAGGDLHDCHPKRFEFVSDGVRKWGRLLSSGHLNFGTISPISSVSGDLGEMLFLENYSSQIPPVKLVAVANKLSKTLSAPSKRLTCGGRPALGAVAISLIPSPLRSTALMLMPLV